MAYNITSGMTPSSLKTVVYGPEGIGKTLLANSFPGAVFIDTEDSTKAYSARRITAPDGSSRPTSWAMLLDMVRAVRDGHASPVGTLVIDSADWAEALCITAVCAKYKKDGIEDFGYGKGYTYLEEEFGKLLNLLSEVIARGIHVVLTAHAAMRRVELPEETGAYDHWELKLEKKDAALVKEWADIVLFCNYKTTVIHGNTPMDKNKAAGGKRVMYTTHTPWWDAKNRHGLPEELPLLFTGIAHLFPSAENEQTAQPPAPPTETVFTPMPDWPCGELPFAATKEEEQSLRREQDVPATPNKVSQPLHELFDLMRADGVSAEQVQAVVAAKGYYPNGTPIENYDPMFVSGCLVACWSSVRAQIKKEN